MEIRLTQRQSRGAYNSGAQINYTCQFNNHIGTVNEASSSRYVSDNICITSELEMRHSSCTSSKRNVT